MAKKRKQNACVYRYGVMPPSEGADIVSAQLRKAHEYFNFCIKLERERRAAARRGRR